MQKHFLILFFLLQILLLYGAETDELRIKGAIVKVHSNSTLTISGSSTIINNSDAGLLKIDENGTLIAEGNINNLSGSSIQIDGQLLAMSDWTNDAVASLAHPGPGTGTVEFAGTANQNIGGTSSTVFENFIINNASGVTLTSNQTISNSLSFSAGIISTGANRLDVTAAGDGMSGYDDGKYIFGNLRRYLSTGIDYHLPIGTAANFELAEIFVYSQTGLNYIDVVFTVSNENPVPGGLMVEGIPVDEFLDYGFWSFIPNPGLSAVNYHATIQSKGHTDKGGTSDNYSLITDIGSGWQNLGTHSSSTQSYSPTAVITKRNYLSTFGSYIVGFSASSVYTPAPVTDELRIKGSVYKVQANSTSTVSNSIVELNNSDAGLLKIDENGTLIAEGNINNLSGSSIQIDGQLLAMSDWTNDAVASLAHPGPGTGTVEFAGTANQNIGGTSSTVFENFIINNASGVTLTSNQTISNSLSFSAGIISTGANRLDVTAAGDGMSGYDDGKYIFGNLRRYLSTGIDYHLPIGTAANFELAEIFVYSQTGLNYIDVVFTVSNENPVPGGLMVEGIPVDEFLDYGFWSFIPNPGLSAVNYHATIQSKGHTDKGGTSDNYSLITDIGSGWQNLGTHSSSTQSYSPTAVITKRFYLSTFGSYIAGFSASSIYTPSPVTDELRIKGSVYKVQASANSTIIGDMVVTNVSNNSILDVKASSDFHTESDIINESGSTIKLNGRINIEGDIINNALINSSGEIIFIGNSDQTIGGSNVTSFSDFTVNKPSGNVILDINTIVSETLKLNSGIIITGSDTLKCTSPLSSKITGYSGNSFVFGFLKKSIGVNTSTYPLPVGNGNGNTFYHLAEFINNNVVGISAITASVASITESGNNVDVNLDPLKAIQDGTELVNVLEDAEWRIDPAGNITAGNFGVNLYVDNISNLSSADDFEFCVLKRNSSSTDYADWDAFSSTTTISNTDQGGRTYITYDGGGIPIGSGFAQRTGYTSFSKFAIAKSGDVPLPVELISFTGELVNGKVYLNWTTLTEVNNEYFSIEKAKWDETNSFPDWEFVLSVRGAGNSSTKIDYFEIDKNPYQGISYYRLKQNDFDGNYFYSNIVQIDNTQILNNTGYVLEFITYPNPSFNEKIFVISTKAYKPENDLYFEITDMLGRKIMSKRIVTDQTGSFNFYINEGIDLNSGLYNARITDFSINKKTISTYSNKLVIK